MGWRLPLQDEATRQDMLTFSQMADFPGLQSVIINKRPVLFVQAR